MKNDINNIDDNMESGGIDDFEVNFINVEVKLMSTEFRRLVLHTLNFSVLGWGFYIKDWGEIQDVEDKEVYCEDLGEMQDFVEVVIKLGEGNICALVEAKEVYGEDWGMFQNFVEVAIKHREGGVRALVEAKEVYGEDLGMFRNFAEVAIEHGEGGVRALVEAKEVYGEDLKVFQNFSKLARQCGEGTVRALVEAKEVYGEDLEMFQDFAEVAIKRGEGGVRTLVEAKEVYGEDLEVFQNFAEVAIKHGEGGVRALVEAKEVYGEDLDVFQDFAEVAIEHGEGSVRALVEAKEVYGEDLDVFQDFAEVAIEHGEGGVRTLVEAKEVYGEDLKVFQNFSKLARQRGEGSVRALVEAKEVYGEDLDVFQDFAEVAIKRGEGSVRALVEAKEVYGEDLGMFQNFAKVAIKRGEGSVRALFEAKEVYGEDLEMFQNFAEVAFKHGEGGVRALVEAKEVYGEDLDVFQNFAEVAIQHGESSVRTLVEAKEVYGEDLGMFQSFAEVAIKGGKDSVRALFEAKEVYGENLGMFQNFAEVATIADGIFKGIFVRGLVKAKKICGNDDKLFQFFIETTLKEDPFLFDVLVEAGIIYGIRSKVFKTYCKLVQDFSIDAVALFALNKVKKTCGDNIKLFNLFVEVLKKNKDFYCIEKLLEIQSIYVNNFEVFKVFVDFLLSGKSIKFLELIFEFKSVYGENLEILNIFVKLANKGSFTDVRCLGRLEKYYLGKLDFLKYLSNNINEKLFDDLSLIRPERLSEFEDLKLFVENFVILSFVDDYVFSEWIKIYKNCGNEKAIEYIDALKKEATKLISSEVPVDIRNCPEYMSIVKYVFSKGNYSDYEKNIAMGDAMEHLSGYSFNRNGYFTNMSGLLGYELKDGSTENIELLEKYSCRLGKIRDFVQSRGPDNNALQKEFEKKVDWFFEELSNPVFAKISGLNLKEKMISLFISEVYKKHISESGYSVNLEILDLIVEYKYAFSENLEDYIVQSADTAKSFKDPVSQRRALWNELSTIYGENLKHILEHDFFIGLTEDNENGGKIINAFSSLFNIKKDEKRLRKNQIEALKNTFENENISEERKKDVFKKQILRIFSANIKFKDGEKEAFEDEVVSVLSEVVFLEFSELERIVPLLFSIREKYVFGINSKLSELFSRDINVIFSELSKYNEILEIEFKEKKMDGDKIETKKSAKNRNVRGYFIKTAETANARMGAYLCNSGSVNMWNNPNYFEFVMKDEDTGKCVGLTMLLKIDSSDGKKYLWFGPNPFESFLNQVSSERCYSFMYDTVCNFARENGFDGVVVPVEEGKILGYCTNRGGDFPDLIKKSRLKNKKGDLEIVEFGGTHSLSGPYSYSNGALIWKK